MKDDKKSPLEKKGILVLRKADEEREIDFELNHLTSLSPQARFALMLNKSRELKTNLEKNGHRTAPTIIKRRLREKSRPLKSRLKTRG